MIRAGLNETGLEQTSRAESGLEPTGWDILCRARIGRPPRRVAAARLQQASLEALECRVLFTGGTGLYASYFSNMSASGTPVYTEIAPTVDFSNSWGITGIPGVPQTQWSARFTGQVQAEYSETYTFATVSDDGARLFVNGQELIDDWSAHASTTDTGTITLVAGQKYNIEMDYYNDTGGDVGQLEWSSPSTPLEVIPQSDLFPNTAPNNLAVTSISPVQVTLGWDYGASDQTSFEIDRSSDGTNYAQLKTVAASATSYRDTSVTSGTQYWYRVSAVTSSGLSPASAIVTANVPAANALPTTPPILSAIAVSTTEIDLLWINAAPDDTGFIVQKSPDGQSSWTTAATLAAGTTNWNDTSLSQGQTVYYRVMATGYNGNSVPTNVASATTAVNWIGSNFAMPIRTGDFNFDNFTAVTFSTPQRSNVFYVGMPVTFGLVGNGAATNGGASNLAVSYQVRDYWGNLVDQGPINDSTNILNINVTQPGWYKVYLYGSTSSTEFGNSVGGTTFDIFDNSPNLPQLPATSMTPGTFAGAPMVTELDPAVDINLPNSTQSPVPTMSETDFSVMWTGQILADNTGAYTFYTESDDGIRLALNGQLLINDWNPHSDTEDSTTVNLIGGTRYNIEIDYYQGGGGAVAQLLWSGPNLAKTLVDSQHLFMDAAATSPGGLLGQYWGTIGIAEPGYDTVMRDVTGIGGERYEVDDATNPQAAEAYLDPLIDYDQESYLQSDSTRDAQLLISFPNLNATDPAQAAGVTAIVAHYKGAVLNFEGLNEPNNSYDGASYVPQEEAFYNAVKAGNPNANVVGPAIVSLGAFCVNWCNSFFSAGGANYINAFSFHAYNVNNGDLQLMEESLQGLKQMLAGWGLSNLPLWQTEQGYAAVNNGLYQPQLQGRWTMLQMVVFDQFNIPKERNYYWYDSSQGDWPWPMWWENDDGSLNPAAALMRVFSQEVDGTNFASAYNFGTDGNNLYVGSLYTGPGKNVGVFMTADQATGNVMLQVNGGSSIHVVSPFGAATDLPVINGYVDLPVTNVPVYVEIAAGQTISVVPQNWGPDLAEESGVTINASNAGNGTSRLNDGVFQNWFWTQDDAGIPFTMPFDNTTPATVEFDLPELQTVDKVVVFSGLPWELTGALMDFEVQYNDNGTWTTLEHITENPQTIGVWTPVTKTNADEYWNEQANFEVDFPPVSTSAVRLVINTVSYGGVSDQLAQQAGGQNSPTPTLDIREVQIFGQ